MNKEIIAGDTLDFYDDVPEFPPSGGWTLKYRLIPRFASPAQSPITITASAEGERYRVQAAAGVTTGWVPGWYGWSRWVEKTGPIRQSLGYGQIRVLTNPETSPAQGSYDTRSHNRKVLEAIEAVIEGRASSSQREMVSYAIGNRSQSFDPNESKASLLELRSKYLWLVKNEDDRDALAAGLPNPRDVHIRFGGS